MTVFATANFIPKKLLLSTMLGSISALLRRSTIEYYPDYVENCNLFILCLGESGCGKSPVCKLACIKPIRELEKDTGGDPIIVDDMTYNGVFQALLKADNSHVPLIALDEGHDFFKKVVSGVRGSLNIRQICRLYDGAWWAEQKGQGKLVKVGSTLLSCISFTTPSGFYKDKIVTSPVLSYTTV